MGEVNAAFRREVFMRTFPDYGITDSIELYGGDVSNNTNLIS